MREVQARGTAAHAKHRRQRSCRAVHPFTVEQPSRAIGRRCPNLEITIQLFCSAGACTKVPDLGHLLLRQQLYAELDEHPREVRWLVGTSAAAARARTSLRQRGSPSWMLTKQMNSRSRSGTSKIAWVQTERYLKVYMLREEVNQFQSNYRSRGGSSAEHVCSTIAPAQDCCNA